MSFAVFLFVAAGIESLIFTSIAVAMLGGYWTPTFGSPNDLGGIASATTVMPLFWLLVAGAFHEIVQHFYTKNRLASATLSSSWKLFDIVTSFAPIMGAIVTFVLYHPGNATWWSWYRLMIFAIIITTTARDTVETIKVVFKRES